MIVTLIQSDIKWADSIANQKAAEAALYAQSQKSDLYILPEMFSTGFATKPDGIAETDDSTLSWMKRMAHQLDAAIAGSVAVRAADGTFRNRFYFVKPDGEVTYYDKHHLFTYGGEHKNYHPGDTRVIVEWRGVRFLLQVCYDLRFPVFARNTQHPTTTTHHPTTNVHHPTTTTHHPIPTIHSAYDAIIYVANWPDSRRRVWDILLQARALENQCFVLGVNRVGDDNLCHYDGGTIAIDAYGKTLAKANDNIPGHITATLDLDRLKAFRNKFPVLSDAD